MTNNYLQHLEGKKVTPDHGNLLLSEYFGKCEKKSIVLVVDEVSVFPRQTETVGQGDSSPIMIKAS